MNESQEGNSNQLIQAEVNRMVRFLVIRAGKNVPINKLAIKKLFRNHQKAQFEDIVSRAARVLKTVYGYNLIQVENSFIISNALPDVGALGSEVENNPEEIPEDMYKILLQLTLSHIFMMRRPVSENCLFSFLDMLNIKVEETDEVFGNVKNLLTVTFKKQGYLNIELDKNTRKATFSWGPRAEKEISQKSILRFVCKMLDTQVESFGEHLIMANNQDQEMNHMEHFPVEMDEI